MTAEERAAVEWLETVDEQEHAERFVPAYGAAELFTVKQDHEVPPSGRCLRCRPLDHLQELVVIE